MIYKFFTSLYGAVLLAFFSILFPEINAGRNSHLTPDVTTQTLMPAQSEEYLPAALRQSENTRTNRNEPENHRILFDPTDVFNDIPAVCHPEQQFLSVNNSDIFIRQICKISISNRDGPDHV